MCGLGESYVKNTRARSLAEPLQGEKKGKAMSWKLQDADSQSSHPPKAVNQGFLKGFSQHAVIFLLDLLTNQ